MHEDTDHTYALHQQPAWRSKANFIINAIVDESGDLDYEQMWARKIDEDHFEICCIPFFLYDIALGDIVQTTESNGKKYMFLKVTKKSGHHTFRVWFGNSKSTNERKRIEEDLKTMPAVLVEVNSKNLLSIDAEDDKVARYLQDYLMREQKLGYLELENGDSKVTF